MTKSELIQRLAERNPHLYQRDVERIVTTIFDEIAAALSRGDRVELRGFGAFSVKRREARQGRNPRTGDSVNVEREAHSLLQDRQAAARAAQRGRREARPLAGDGCRSRSSPSCSRSPIATRTVALWPLPVRRHCRSISWCWARWRWAFSSASWSPGSTAGTGGARRASGSGASRRWSATRHAQAKGVRGQPRSERADGGRRRARRP